MSDFPSSRYTGKSLLPQGTVWGVGINSLSDVLCVFISGVIPKEGSSAQLDRVKIEGEESQTVQIRNVWPVPNSCNRWVWFIGEYYW